MKIFRNSILLIVGLLLLGYLRITVFLPNLDNLMNHLEGNINPTYKVNVSDVEWIKKWNMPYAIQFKECSVLKDFSDSVLNITSIEAKLNFFLLFLKNEIRIQSISASEGNIQIREFLGILQDVDRDQASIKTIHFDKIDFFESQERVSRAEEGATQLFSNVRGIMTYSDQEFAWAGIWFTQILDSKVQLQFLLKENVGMLPWTLKDESGYFELEGVYPIHQDKWKKGDRFSIKVHQWPVQEKRLSEYFSGKMTGHLDVLVRSFNRETWNEDGLELSGVVDIRDGRFGAENLVSRSLQNLTSLRAFRGLFLNLENLSQKYQDIFFAKEMVYDSIKMDVSLKEGVFQFTDIDLRSDYYLLFGDGSLDLNSNVTESELDLVLLEDLVEFMMTREEALIQYRNDVNRIVIPIHYHGIWESDMIVDPQIEQMLKKLN